MPRGHNEKKFIIFLVLPNLCYIACVIGVQSLSDGVQKDNFPRLFCALQIVLIANQF